MILTGTHTHEIRRLREDFEVQASKYPDLALTRYYLILGEDPPVLELKKPDHAISLWQYVGAFTKDNVHTAFVGPPTKYGLPGATLSAYAVVHGAETELFRRMSTRAGSLLSDQIDADVTAMLMRRFVVPPEMGKGMFVRNPNAMARWLNLMFFTIAKYQPQRAESFTLPVDPFAASLTVFDYVLGSTAVQMDSPATDGSTVNKIKTLFLSANPTRTTRLALDEELRDIQEKIRASEHRDAFEMVVIPAARPEDIEQALLQHKPVIVHFSGHGSSAGGLVFHGEGAEAKLVSANAIGDLFRLLKKNVRIVVLNACYSEEQAKAIVREVDFVVGMSDTIGDLAARKFAASFYRGLGFGETVEVAFGLGVNAIKRENLVRDEDVPVLLVREGLSAEVVLLGPR